MRFTGKLVGAVLGALLLRHPLAIVLGIAIGHAFDAGWLRWHGPRPAPPRAEGEDDPYAVLGVEPDASDEDIERAWRRLMARHHPDRVAGEAARAQAERRARELNAAFDRIQVLRGRRR